MTPFRLLRWNLGLGDTLLCNGLVRTLVDRGNRLLIPAYQHNEASVRDSFLDLIQNGVARILIVGDDNYATPMNCDGEINIGFSGPHFDRAQFDYSFYQQAGVPFRNKWERAHFPLAKASMAQCPMTGGKRLFVVHDDPSRGFNIPVNGYRFQKSPSIFDHWEMLSSAMQFDGINSCFAILADLAGIEAKKVLHVYARPDGGELPIFGSEWHILREPHFDNLKKF